MTESFFKDQVKRLRSRFGDKAFDNEFVLLVWRECCTMSETAFARYCDMLIGHRTHNKPPLLAEFREARLAEEKLRLNNEAAQAARALNDPRGGHGLRKYLDRTYGKGCKSLWEAVEIERHRLKIAESESDGDGPKGAA